MLLRDNPLVTNENYYISDENFDPLKMTTQPLNNLIPSKTFDLLTQQGSCPFTVDKKNNSIHFTLPKTYTNGNFLYSKQDIKVKPNTKYTFHFNRISTLREAKTVIYIANNGDPGNPVQWLNLPNLYSFTTRDDTTSIRLYFYPDVSFQNNIYPESGIEVTIRDIELYEGDVLIPSKNLIGDLSNTFVGQSYLPFSYDTADKAITFNVPSPYNPGNYVHSTLKVALTPNTRYTLSYNSLATVDGANTKILLANNGVAVDWLNYDTPYYFMTKEDTRYVELYFYPDLNYKKSDFDVTIKDIAIYEGMPNIIPYRTFYKNMFEYDYKEKKQIFEITICLEDYYAVKDGEKVVAIDYRKGKGCFNTREYLFYDYNNNTYYIRSKNTNSISIGDFVYLYADMNLTLAAVKNRTTLEPLTLKIVSINTYKDGATMFKMRLQVVDVVDAPPVRGEVLEEREMINVREGKVIEALECGNLALEFESGKDHFHGTFEKVIYSSQKVLSCSKKIGDTFESVDYGFPAIRFGLSYNPNYDMLINSYDGYIWEPQWINKEYNNANYDYLEIWVKGKDINNLYFLFDYKAQQWATQLAVAPMRERADGTYEYVLDENGQPKFKEYINGNHVIAYKWLIECDESSDVWAVRFYDWSRPEYFPSIVNIKCIEKTQTFFNAIKGSLTQYDCSTYTVPKDGNPYFAAIPTENLITIYDVWGEFPDLVEAGIIKMDDTNKIRLKSNKFCLSTNTTSAYKYNIYDTAKKEFELDLKSATGVFNDTISIEYYLKYNVSAYDMLINILKLNKEFFNWTEDKFTYLFSPRCVVSTIEGGRWIHRTMTVKEYLQRIIIKYAYFPKTDFVTAVNYILKVAQLIAYEDKEGETRIVSGRPIASTLDVRKRYYIPMESRAFSDLKFDLGSYFDPKMDIRANNPKLEFKKLYEETFTFFDPDEIETLNADDDDKDIKKAEPPYTFNPSANAQIVHESESNRNRFAILRYEVNLPDNFYLPLSDIMNNFSTGDKKFWLGNTDKLAITISIESNKEWCRKSNSGGVIKVSWRKPQKDVKVIPSQNGKGGYIKHTQLLDGGIDLIEKNPKLFSSVYLSKNESDNKKLVFYQNINFQHFYGNAETEWNYTSILDFHISISLLILNA